MPKPVSKTVDKALKRCFARLADAAFREAVKQVSLREFAGAERTMTFVTDWLEKAGAEATKDYFYG